MFCTTIGKVVLFYCNKLQKEEIRIAAKGQRSGHFVDCENCGKNVYQTNTQYDRAKHHFCSNKCQKEYQHRLAYEDRECPICGKVFSTSKKSTKLLCSVECQKIWQTQQVGTKNVRFQRVLIPCEECGKEFYVKPYKIKSGQHNFCSIPCKRKWYAEEWSQTEEWKDESRKRAVRILEEGRMSFTESAPQVIINNMLNNMGIKYQNEYSCKYYSIDNYLEDENLMIEVMGDYWHCNPITFPKIKQDVQKKRIPKDKAKHTYIRNKYNIEILYLWENDIHNRGNICQKLIQQYINNNGVLDNYHSFNYTLNSNDELVLIDELIIPYQDMDIETTKQYYAV